MLVGKVPVCWLSPLNLKSDWRATTVARQPHNAVSVQHGG